MLVSLLVAVAVSTGVPIKAEPTVSPAKWVVHSDIPKSEWSRSASTTFDLVIDKTGKPVKCDIVTPSGSDLLDKTVCVSVMKRARFDPAKDVSGTPIISVWRDRVVWRPKGAGYNRWYDAPDIVAQTETLTGKKTKMTTVIVAIDGAGQVEQCFVAKSSKDKALDERACNIARKPEISQAIRDEVGAVTPGIRSFFVGFAAGNSPEVIVL